MFKILTLFSAPFGPKSEGINIHIPRQSGKEKPYQIRFGPSVWAGGIPLADYNLHYMFAPHIIVFQVHQHFCCLKLLGFPVC